MEDGNKKCSSDISSKLKEIEITELLDNDLASLISKYSHPQKKEANNITENDQESDIGVGKKENVVVPEKKEDQNHNIIFNNTDLNDLEDLLNKEDYSSIKNLFKKKDKNTDKDEDGDRITPGDGVDVPDSVDTSLPENSLKKEQNHLVEDSRKTIDVLDENNKEKYREDLKLFFNEMINKIEKLKNEPLIK